MTEQVQLPTADEHRDEVFHGIVRARQTLGVPTVGARGQELALLRIEAQNAQIIDLLSRLVEMAEGASLPATVPEVEQALAPIVEPESAPIALDLDALSASELRDLCDARGVEPPDRRSKRAMREALRTAQEG